MDLNCLQVHWFVSLSFRAEWKGESLLQHLPVYEKAIWAHGSWEGCLPGEGLSFRAPQFLTEHKMIFLNVSNYICGSVGGEVHKCDRKRNCFRNKDLFSAHTAMMVFQALHWMPLEGLHRRACVESWREQYCSHLSCSWEKSKSGASLGCRLCMSTLSSSHLSCKHLYPSCIRHQGQPLAGKIVIEGYYDS